MQWKTITIGYVYNNNDFIYLVPPCQDSQSTAPKTIKMQLL